MRKMWSSDLRAAPVRRAARHDLRRLREAGGDGSRDRMRHEAG